MKKVWLLVLALLPCMAAAKSLELLPQAMDAYRERGAQAFVSTLLKGSPLEEDKTAISQGALLVRIEAYYGDPKRLVVLSECALTDRARITFFSIYYARGPVYGSAESFTTEEGEEIVTRFNINTEFEEVLSLNSLVDSELCTRVH